MLSSSLPPSVPAFHALTWMSWWRSLWSVWRKELRDMARDRRTLAVALGLAPLLLPIVMLGMGALVQQQTKTAWQAPLTVSATGMAHAPHLVAWLANQGITLEEAPSDIRKAIQEGRHNVWIEIDEAYPRTWFTVSPAPIAVYTDSSHRVSAMQGQRILGTLQHYSQQVGALRLLARGVDPGVARAVAPEPIDLATPGGRVAQTLVFLPYFLMLTAFLGSAYLVIDLTAGERERLSIEPLLCTPVPRTALVSGKILAASTWGSAGLLLGLLTCVAGLHVTPGLAGFVSVPWITVVSLAFALLPLVLLGSTLVTVLAAGASSVKEAQSYVSLLMLIPLIPSMFLMIVPVQHATWMCAIPFLAHNQIILALLRATALPWQDWLVYITMSLVVLALLWTLALRLYAREKLALV